MQLAIVIVHYRTPHLVAPAVAALVADLRTSGLEAELLLVDNGSDPGDRGLFAALPVRRLEPGRNLGYAGGVNLGVRESTAERLVVMNPDVLVVPGCVAALAAALDGGAAAAGPRFFWDRGKRWLLPPTEVRSRRAEVLAVLARRGGRWAALGRRRWRRHARRHWLAQEPLASYELSGALLAFRRSAWEQIGPFDEEYRLYFEETDWLHRLRAAGLPARYLPGAEAVHLYAQSTVREPRAERWFLASHRRFRRRFFGTGFTAALELLSRRLGPQAEPEAADGPDGGSEEDNAWLEIAGSAAGYPAASRPPVAGTEPVLPDEVRERMAPGTYFLRAVDQGGREGSVRRLVVPWDERGPVSSVPGRRSDDNLQGHGIPSDQDVRSSR